MAPLKATYENQCQEAGVDEAGRGCLAGPVFAAAVIFNTHIPLSITQHLNDSKKLSKEQRNRLRTEIEMHALSWAIGVASNEEIDQINILNASFLAMHRALEKLRPQPELLLIDGNRFKPYRQTRHACIVKGDGMYLSIAAASVLAKTYRDDFMHDAHLQLPHYCWDKNKGYPTLQHKMAIAQFGLSPLHRKSFNSGLQTKLDL
jgi:ribonuclease HII